MKRFMKAAWILAASALAFSSCIEEQAITPEEGQSDKVTVNITAGSVETKTHYDNTLQIKWDQAGEKLKVLENSGTSVAYVNSSEGQSSDGSTAKFTANFKKVTGATSFDYYAVYPSTSAPSYGNKINSAKLELPTVQHPTATSFDPAADLLVSKGVHMNVQATDLSFQFARPVAIMEMTVKGLKEGEKINSVEFSSQSAILSGSVLYDFNAGAVVEYGDQANPEKTVTCIYDTPIAVNATDGNKIYFTVLPTGKNASIADFTVNVLTDKATYTKTVSEKNLTIKPNQLVKFSIGLSAREAHEFTLCTDAASLQAGDKILIVADDANLGTVAMAGQDKDFRKYVQVKTESGQVITVLPTGIQIIELVDSQTPGEFKLRTSNRPVLELEHHGKGASKLYSEPEGSSWKISTTNGITEITTLCEPKTGTALETRYLKFNTAYPRFSSYVDSFRDGVDIQIFCKGTPKTPLATPTDLLAEQEDKNVNELTVIWSEVANAASYTVFCGNKEPLTVTTTSATITDLDWATTHTIKVVANPQKGDQTYRASAPAETTAAIGDAPATNIPLKDGNYVVMYNTGTSYMGLTSNKSTYNLEAAAVKYDGSAQSVTVAKEFIWKIERNALTGEYSFLSAAANQYMIMTTGSHNNAALGAGQAFHALSKTGSHFTIGDANKLWYKAKYTEFTFDGEPKADPNADPVIKGDENQLLIIPATVDETPVYSLDESTVQVASSATTAATLSTLTANDFITESNFSVLSDQTWLTNLKVAGGKVVADVAENATNAARQAKVTVTYVGAKVAKQTINVSQVAAGQGAEVTISWDDLRTAGGWADKADMSGSSATIKDFTFKFLSASKAYSSEMRFYSKNKMTISHSSKKITKVVLNNGTKADYNGTAVSSVTLTNPNSSQIKVKSITITVE